jgi:hypothetical protein
MRVNVNVWGTQDPPVLSLVLDGPWILSIRDARPWKNVPFRLCRDLDPGFRRPLAMIPRMARTLKIVSIVM